MEQTSLDFAIISQLQPQMRDSSIMEIQLSTLAKISLMGALSISTLQICSLIARICKVRLVILNYFQAWPSFRSMVNLEMLMFTSQTIGKISRWMNPFNLWVVRLASLLRIKLATFILMLTSKSFMLRQVSVITLKIT